MKGKGRVVNARFAVMCAHYLFDADFCNVASGWEKEVVEKNVQYSRRRIWLDAQKDPVGIRLPSSPPDWASAAGLCGASCATPSTGNSAYWRCWRCWSKSARIRDPERRFKQLGSHGFVIQGWSRWPKLTHSNFKRAIFEIRKAPVCRLIRYCRAPRWPDNDCVDRGGTMGKQGWL